MGGQRPRGRVGGRGRGRIIETLPVWGPNFSAAAIMSASFAFIDSSALTMAFLCSSRATVSSWTYEERCECDSKAGVG